MERRFDLRVNQTGVGQTQPALFNHANPPRQRQIQQSSQIQNLVGTQSTAEPPRQRAEYTSLSSSLRDARTTPAIIGAATEQSPEQASYGSSSAGSFIQHVRRVVEQKTALSSSALSPNTIHNRGNMPLMFPDDDTSPSEIDSALPTRKRADNLVNMYWTSTHILYPILDRNMVLDDYESLWKGDGLISHERSFLCLLNVIFALSSRLVPTSTPQERAESASVFYSRAKDLLQLGNTASVRYVQIYLLFGLYLQSTSEPHSCWIFVGLAVRTAQSLNLHLSTTSEHIKHFRYKSLLRRVWHGCVFLDRTLAMTYGRPCMIAGGLAHSVPYPDAVEGEGISPDRSDPNWSNSNLNPSLTDYFIHSLTLYDILHDILINFYSPESQQLQSIDHVYEHFFEVSTRPRGGFTVLEIDRRLYQWKIKLPIHLQFASYAEGLGPVTMLSRQALVLRQR